MAKTFKAFVIAQSSADPIVEKFIRDTKKDSKFPADAPWGKLKNYLFHKYNSNEAEIPARALWRQYKDSLK